MAPPFAMGEMGGAARGCARPAVEPAFVALASRLLDAAWAPGDGIALLERSGTTGLTETLPVITDAARLLGEWWSADSCSFADVTLGLHRLTLLLFALEAQPDWGRAGLHGGAVLLALAPGDQHGFGLATVAAALRHRGWDVTVDLQSDEAALVRRAAARRFTCIGLSVGHDRAVTPTRRLIERLRRAGRAPYPAVAIGGPMLTRMPDLAAEVGADLTTADGFALGDALDAMRLSCAA